MTFTQAAMPVENAQLFAVLKGMIDNALAPANLESFLKGLRYYGITPRQFERVLEEKLLEQTRGAKAGDDAGKTFAALALGDQAQIREHYLTHIENVPQELRHKFRKVFQYA
jgi:hypothetical protein